MEGPACRRSRHTSTASSRARTSYPTGATHCLPMHGLRQTGACGEGEARLILDREARHDRLCLPRLSGSSTRSWRSRHTAISTTKTRSRTSGHRQCRTIDGASPCPARRTATATRSSGSTGTGLPIVCGTDGTLHPKSRRHLEELHADVEKPSIRAAFATAYVAAKANEHLTRMIRRDRAESLVTQSDRLLSTYF